MGEDACNGEVGVRVVKVTDMDMDMDHDRERLGVSGGLTSGRARASAIAAS